MPSFFESLRRMATGQPVFVPGEEVSKAGQSQAPQSTAPKSAPSGPKVLPVVVITWVVCQNDGPGMECEVRIRNQSQQEVRLQRIELLGMTDELGEFLQPGDEHEYTFHFAARPANTSQNIAKLFYQNHPEGDYFCAHHLVEFEKLADSSYTVRSVRFQSPVRDV